MWLACLAVLALAPASLGARAAPSDQLIAGTWSFRGARVLITPAGPGRYVGDVVGSRPTFSSGCPHRVGERMWRFRGSGGSYRGTHEGFGHNGCQDRRTYPATWEVRVSGGSVLLRFCTTITVAGNRVDCATLRRAAPLRRGDTVAPSARALPAAARPGAVVELRYRASDNGGRTREEIVVKQGTRVVAAFKTPFARSARGETYAITWRVPVALAGTLTVCVRSIDPAGNASAYSCAPLRLGG